MKVYRLKGLGLDQLVCGEEDAIAPGAGEVRVRMAHASLNARDVGVVAGHYPLADNLIPLSDGAGIIDAVGPGVTGFAVGDAVVSCFFVDWPAGETTPETRATFGSQHNGMLAEAVILPVSGIVHKPASLTLAEAATLPCAALTAWSALFDQSPARPGKHVVVQGTGGVAIFALQFAKMAGATVTVISSADDKLDRARQLGADHLVNYRSTPDWAAAVTQFTRGAGADIVIELGGTQTLAASLDCLRHDGTIAIIGVLSGLDANLPLVPTIYKRARIQGVNVGHREGMLAMGKAIDAHGIKPVIDRHYDFADAAQAYRDLPSGGHFGKLVIDIGVG
jgi:NADPH:quinone reductase-like Zn-dependent oxidoreductase